MDKDAVEMARVEFDRAFQNMTDLTGTEYFAEIERHWSTFLVHAGRVFTRLEQASKSPPQSYAWWGQKLHQRRTDPLLCYIWHARNADEHGLRKVTQKHPGSFNLIRPPPEGPPHGEVEIVFPHIELVDVFDRGNRYPVPQSHRGEAIHNPNPTNVGLLALSDLEAMIKEAEELCS